MRLINADALKKTFENACIYGLPMNELYGAILKIIDNAPTVIWCSETPEGLPLMDMRERPQGEWVYTDKEDKEEGYGGYCFVCKCDMPIGMNDWKQEYYESNFCPNCGAEMKKRTDAD